MHVAVGEVFHQAAGVLNTTLDSVAEMENVLEKTHRVAPLPRNSLRTAGGASTHHFAVWLRRRFILARVSDYEPGWRPDARGGHPFGAQVVVFKSVPSAVDVDLACTIEDGQGRPLGIMRSVNVSGWQQFAQSANQGSAVSWEFDILGTDGARRLNISRPRVRGWRDWRERVELRDSGGRYVGCCLLQNNSYLAALKTFALETDQAALGYTTFDYKRIGGAFGKTATRTVTIHDSTDRITARLTQRQQNGRSRGSDFYDYMLTFDFPPTEPMGNLCLTVAVTEYFYRRTVRGGPLRWTSR